MNFINVLCAKKMLFIHTHHVSGHVISSLYHVSSCLCCSFHCHSTSRQRSKSLWLHPKVTGCNPLSHYSRFAILLKTFIVSLEMLMRYNNSCNDCNTVHTVWELRSMFWGSVYMEKTCLGGRVTLQAESIVANIYMRKTLTPLTDQQPSRMLWLSCLDWVDSAGRAKTFMWSWPG